MRKNQKADQDKSIIRAKKSTITIADLLARESIATIIPAGGLIYDTTKALISHGKAYFDDRTQNRIDEFHSVLLNGKENEDDFSSFVNKPFDLDDYYAVLSSCVQDIENEKVEIYSMLMKSLIESELNQDMRRHLIKSCKELTYSELYFLKDLYINSKYDLMTAGGTQEQVKKILSSKDPFRLLTIDKLKLFGFIDIKDKNITSLSENFISLIFDAQALKPESIGHKPFSGINIVIVSYQLDDERHTKIAPGIQEVLFSKQIKSFIQILNKRSLTTCKLVYNIAILIVDNKPISAEHIESLTEFSERKPIIRLNIDDNSHNNDLTNIGFSDELTLKSTEQLAVKKQVNEYISKIIDQAN